MVHPMLTAILYATLIDSTSNTIAQRLRAYQKSIPFVFDRQLFLNYLILVILTAPLNYLWQNFLERQWPGWKLVPRSSRLGHAGGTEKHNDARGRAGGGDGSGTGEGLLDHPEGVEMKGKDEEWGLGEGQGEEMIRVRNWRNNWTKWFADCITWGAIFNTVLFLAIMGVLKGKKLPDIGDDLRTKTLTIIWNSYKIWPFANIISTTFIPVEKRIVFLSFCGLLWNIYLSLVAADL